MSNDRPTPEKIKEKAKLVKKIIKEKCDFEISHSHSLELVSQVFGFKDWNTASALIKPKENGIGDFSNSIKIKTVGDMKKALELFNDTDMIDADYTFKVIDFMESLWDVERPDDEILQEFSLSIAGFNEDILTFKLNLDHESIRSDLVALSSKEHEDLMKIHQKADSISSIKQKD